MERKVKKNIQLINLIITYLLLPILVAFLLCTAESRGVYAATEADPYRPLYHVTPQSGWMGDVQRPLYINGTHQLYYLNNLDYSWGGNGTAWAHADSTDLVNWNRKPIAIQKYQTPYGDPWTGSLVVDKNNTAGFGTNAVIALVTMPYEHQSTHLWYSTDDGNSFQYYGIVQHNPTGSSDFRDPKVVWNEDTGKWVMTLAENNKIGFYTSSNLKSWQYVSSFIRQDIGIIECPDLFQINVDGNSNNKKWVLAMGGNGFNYGLTTGTCYFVGNFDGEVFTKDPGSDLNWLEEGADSYTGVTWDAPYTDGNYRYFISWMNNWNYAFQLPWQNYSGNTSIVREIRLNTTSNGLKLQQVPVWNLLSNFNEVMNVENQTVYNNQQNILDNYKGLSYSIETQIDVSDLTNGKFGFSVRNGLNEHTDITYDKSINQLSFDRSNSGIVVNVNEFINPQRITVNHVNGKIKLTILVDVSTVEIFVNDGQHALSNIIFPSLTSDGVRLWTDGHVHLDYLKIRNNNNNMIN